MSAIATKVPAAVPWLKGGMEALKWSYAGSVGVGAMAQKPGFERYEYVGEKVQPVALLGLGGYAYKRVKLSGMTWEGKTTGTKYGKVNIPLKKPVKMRGLSESESWQWKRMEEGKIAMITPELKSQIKGREELMNLIRVGKAEEFGWDIQGTGKSIVPKSKSNIFGENWYKSMIEKSTQLWKYEDLVSEKPFNFAIPNYKAEMKKVSIDFSKIERLKPLGEDAALTTSEFFAQRKYITVGGSVIPGSIYDPEFKGYKIENYIPEFKEFKTKKIKKGYEIPIHDIDTYTDVNMIKPSKEFYNLLGGKEIPKVVDIDKISKLDIYEKSVFDITRKRGGRVGGGVGIDLQIEDLGRGRRDWDIEFDFKKLKTTPSKMAKNYLSDLEKRHGLGLWAIDIASRHPKVVWTKDVGTHKAMGTFVDIGKLRAGFKEREISYGMFRKKLKVIDIRDLLFKDKTAIVKYTETSPKKGIWTKKELDYINKKDWFKGKPTGKKGSKGIKLEIHHLDSGETKIINRLEHKMIHAKEEGRLTDINKLIKLQQKFDSPIKIKPLKIIQKQ